MTQAASEITVDRLPEAGSSLEVVTLHDARYGADSECGPRRPHRHDYHELVWTRCGAGRHLIDGEVSDVEPNTMTLIGRGQVHVFERASGLHGAIVRFGEELLQGDPAAAANPAWLVSSRAVRVVGVPEGEVRRLRRRSSRSPRRPAGRRTRAASTFSATSSRPCCCGWSAGTRPHARSSATPTTRTSSCTAVFGEVLERDYARHHDAPRYADTLGVPHAALSRALAAVTGRTTKELITDRRMLEAARLLRFSEMSVGEIAFRAGYGDQLYFSRAFKRQFGEAAKAYRDRMRGRAPER